MSQLFASLHQKRVFVAGSSSGIGQAIAIELACAGADVGIHFANNQSGASETRNAIESLGKKAAVFQADLSTPLACQELVRSSWIDFGPIDIWVHAAGVDLLTGEKKSLSFEQKLQQLLDVDVRATAIVTKSIGELMRDRGRGVILTVGWDQADRGMEGDSGELFSLAKNAVMGWTRSLAVSLAPRVRVNCIAPGWIKTAWGETASEEWQQRVRNETPLQRWGLPSDLASLARYLCSDEAAYLTGQIINANGGAVR